MNDTAQETTTAMAVLVEHELLGASLLSVEGKIKQSYISIHLPVKLPANH